MSQICEAKMYSRIPAQFSCPNSFPTLQLPSPPKKRDKEKEKSWSLVC